MKHKSKKHKSKKHKKAKVKQSKKKNYKKKFKMKGGWIWPNDKDWVKDSLVKQCQSCETPFYRPFRRKHHCRICGKIFCNSCSNYRVFRDTLNAPIYNLPHHIFEKNPNGVRACVHCAAHVGNGRAKADLAAEATKAQKKMIDKGLESPKPREKFWDNLDESEKEAAERLGWKAKAGTVPMDLRHPDLTSKELWDYGGGYALPGPGAVAGTFIRYEGPLQIKWDELSQELKEDANHLGLEEIDFGAEVHEFAEGEALPQFVESTEIESTEIESTEMGGTTTKLRVSWSNTPWLAGSTVVKINDDDVRGFDALEVLQKLRIEKRPFIVRFWLPYSLGSQMAYNQKVADEAKKEEVANLRVRFNTTSDTELQIKVEAVDSIGAEREKLFSVATDESEENVVLQFGEWLTSLGYNKPGSKKRKKIEERFRGSFSRLRNFDGNWIEWGEIDSETLKFKEKQGTNTKHLMVDEPPKDLGGLKGEIVLWIDEGGWQEDMQDLHAVEVLQKLMGAGGSLMIGFGDPSNQVREKAATDLSLADDAEEKRRKRQEGGHYELGDTIEIFSETEKVARILAFYKANPDSAPTDHNIPETIARFKKENPDEFTKNSYMRGWSVARVDGVNQQDGSIYVTYGDGRGKWVNPKNNSQANPTDKKWEEQNMVYPGLKDDFKFGDTFEVFSISNNKWFVARADGAKRKDRTGKIVVPVSYFDPEGLRDDNFVDPKDPFNVRPMVALISRDYKVDLTEEGIAGIFRKIGVISEDSVGEVNATLVEEAGVAKLLSKFKLKRDQYGGLRIVDFIQSANKFANSYVVFTREKSEEDKGTAKTAKEKSKGSWFPFFWTSEEDEDKAQVAKDKSFEEFRTHIINLFQEVKKGERIEQEVIAASERLVLETEGAETD